MSKHIFEEASTLFWGDKDQYLVFFGRNTLNKLFEGESTNPSESVSDVRAAGLLEYISDFIRININEYKELGDEEFERIRGEMIVCFMLYREIIKRFK